MTQTLADDPITYLVHAKFPLLAFHTRGKTAEAEHLKIPLDDLLREADAYRRILEKKSSQDIRLLVLDTKQNIEQVRNRMQAGQPIYEQSSANADFDYWSKVPHWTLDEAIALSFGKEPTVINWATIQKYASTSAFAKEYGKLRNLALRAVPWKQLFDPVTPGLFIAWTKRNEIPFPEELEKLAVKRGGNIMDWKAAYDTALEEHDKYAATMQEQLDAAIAIAKRNEKIAEDHVHLLNHKIDQINELTMQKHTLKIKVSELEASQKTKTTDNSYHSPYIDLMLQAITENKITNKSQGKKETLKQWFRDNALSELKISDKKADMMATLIRLPESGVGGNKKQNQ